MLAAWPVGPPELRGTQHLVLAVEPAIRRSVASLPRGHAEEAAGPDISGQLFMISCGAMPAKASPQPVQAKLRCGSLKRTVFDGPLGILKT